MDELYSLPGVEIFRAGTWNGDKYNEADLDEMIGNFSKVGYDVPLKLGHSDTVGEPAYGWVQSVRRFGDKIIADFRDMPKAIYDAVRNRRFDAVSSEIFFDLKRNGETFRRALKAVALLGAETPAVAGLLPLRESLRGIFTEDDLKAVRAYTFQQETPPMTETAKTYTQAELDAKVAELKAEADKAKLLQAQIDASEGDNETLLARVTELSTRLAATEESARKLALDTKVDAIKLPALRPEFRSLYALALNADAPKVVTYTAKDKDGKVAERNESPEAIVDALAAKLNTHMAKMFTETGKSDERREAAPADDKPGAEVHRLTMLKMASDKTDYSQAMAAVLADPANDELKRNYALLG